MDTKDRSVSLGIGDGTGNKFVYGNIDNIIYLQARLLRYEKVA